MFKKLHRFWERYQQMPAAVRTSFWFTICNFLQRGTALITVPIFTRILTTKEYGICNIYFAWFEIAVLFTSLKMPYEGLNNGLIRYEEEKDAYVSSIAGAIIVLSVLVCTLAFPFRRQIADFSGLNQKLLFLMVLQILFNPAFMLWTNRNRFDFQYRLPVLATMIMTVLSPVISMVAIFYTPYHAEARVMGPVLVQVILGIICYGILFRKGRTIYHRRYWRFAIGFNLPLIFYYLSQTVLNQADRLMIGNLAGDDKVGIYSVAYTAATLVLLLISAINGSLHPWMLKKMKKQEKDEMSRVVFSLLGFVFMGTMAMTAFAPDIVKILATREYQEAIWIIPPVSASTFFIFLYMIFANVEMYYDKKKWIPVISILASIGNIILNQIFIPRFGYLAAGWTTLACYILLAFLHWLCARGAIAGEGKIMVLVILELASSFVMLASYRLGLMRYVIIAIMALFLLFTQDRWRQLLQNLKDS